MGVLRVIKEEWVRYNDMDFYFKHVKTESDYWRLRATGLAWEFFPSLPASWEQHLIMLAQREANATD